MMCIKFNYGWLFLLIAMAGDFIVSILCFKSSDNLFGAVSIVCFVFSLKKMRHGWRINF